jgi:uncharacterized protein YegP (UPF0339 family)
MANPSPRKEEIGLMPTRYEYDLDSNNEWRWIAIGANGGATVAVSPVGYASLQDCMHAVGLIKVPGNLAVVAASAGVAAAPDPPERSLSRLQLNRRP